MITEALTTLLAHFLHLCLKVHHQVILASMSWSNHLRTRSTLFVSFKLAQSVSKLKHVSLGPALSVRSDYARLAKVLVSV